MALDIALPIPIIFRAAAGINNNAWFPVNNNVIGGPGIPTPKALFKLIISAQTDSDVRISFDGINDHDFLLAETVREIDFETNSTTANVKCALQKGTIFYIRGVGGAGTVRFMGWYQPFNAHDITI